MAPFKDVSPDRPSRFGDGSCGVLYVAANFQTALLETIHHHGRFMARGDYALCKPTPFGVASPH
jgi:hypothetical protein